MILIGLCVGPIFNFVDQSLFEAYTALVATITLVLVLLDSGISLNVFDTMKSLGKAIVFTLLVLFFSTFLVGIFFIYVVGWEPLYALLMGVVSSGSTTIVPAFLLPRLNVPGEIGQILFIESVINDVTLITSAVVIIQIIDLGTTNVNQILTAFFQPISIAIILGIIFTIVWVNVLWKFYKGEELAYVFTLGMIFILYSVVEFIGGNAAIAILVLTLSLGNIPLLLEILIRRRGSLGFIKFDMKSLKNLKGRFGEILGQIRKSQFDFTFFIQNFFFVYLGIIFDLNKFDFFLIMICIIVLSLMFVSRYFSARILSLFRKNIKPYSVLMASMVARGFTATFVALLPSTRGVDIPMFKEVVLAMVLLSTIATMFGCIIFERKKELKS
jgi:cell volume regulation protein A